MYLFEVVEVSETTDSKLLADAGYVPLKILMITNILLLIMMVTIQNSDDNNSAIDDMVSELCRMKNLIIKQLKMTIKYMKMWLRKAIYEMNIKKIIVENDVKVDGL